MDLKNLTAKDIEWIKTLMEPMVSLNAPVRTNERGEEIEEIGSFIEDTAPGPEELCIEQERRELLDKYMKEFLSPKHLQVIRLRFGFEDNHCWNFAEIAKKLNISRERARQIEMTALKHLRLGFKARGITMEDL